jgi:site-specific DNA-methyltransferase (adenine-specific)
VTSPPYAVGIDYEGTSDIPADQWPSFMFNWLTEAFRVAKPGGRLALDVPLDTTAGGYRPAYVDAVRAALDAGWRYRATIAWVDDHLGKSVARGSIDSAAAPHIVAGQEMVAVFYKGEWRREPPCQSDLSHPDWLAWTNGVWRFSGESRPWEAHPAPFPPELPRRLLLLLSFPGDVVLDPFVGSGTTTAVAAGLGRQAIGFDASAEYVEAARRRVASLAQSVA